MTPAGGSTFGSTAHFATPTKDQWPITNMAPAATECPSSTHSHGSAFIVTGARRPRRSISTRSFSGTPTRRDNRTGGNSAAGLNPRAPLLDRTTANPVPYRFLGPREGQLRVDCLSPNAVVARSGFGALRTFERVRS